MRERSRLNDWLAALSLSNLVFLSSWTSLLGMNQNNLFYLNRAPSPAHYYSLMLDVLVVGACFYGVAGLLHRRVWWAVRLLPAAGILLLFPMVNSLAEAISDPGSWMVLRFVVEHTLKTFGLLAVALLAALLIGGIRTMRPVYHLLKIVSPLVLFTFGQSVYHLAAYQPNTPVQGALAPRLAAKAAGSPRVLWLIFDEWDPELSFTERPSRIQLPEIDRLRAGAFFATRAVRPNRDTILSMPALTTGRDVEAVRTNGPSELMIRFKGASAPVEWSRQDNVFREARQLGFNTAVAAWALPYCRVMKDDLSECAWWSDPAPINNLGESFPEMFVNQLRGLYETENHSPFGLSLSARRHLEVAQAVQAKSVEVARDASVGLALLHLPVPHSPFFYNAATGRNDFGANGPGGMFQRASQGYIDALVLVDRSLGELRRSMEQAGTWDTTTVIVSADHPLRTRPGFDGHPVSRYVPFLVKLAGPAQAREYTAPFQTLLTKELILAMLRGEISRTEQLAAWVDAHRAEFPAE